jgi:hypothetical protein
MHFNYHASFVFNLIIITNTISKYTFVCASFTNFTHCHCSCNWVALKGVGIDDVGVLKLLFVSEMQGFALRLGQNMEKKFYCE